VAIPVLLAGTSCNLFARNSIHKKFRYCMTIASILKYNPKLAVYIPETALKQFHNLTERLNAVGHLPSEPEETSG
jgi:hypothetical protein